MQFRKFKTIAAFIVVAIALYACEADYIAQEPAIPDTPADTTGNDTTHTVQSIISYSGEIQPVFTAKCMPCHAAGKAQPILEEGKSYQSLMSIGGMVDTVSPANSALYKSMKPGGSMSNYCSKKNADSVYKWIDQGAKNN